MSHDGLDTSKLSYPETIYMYLIHRMQGIWLFLSSKFVAYSFHRDDETMLYVSSNEILACFVHNVAAISCIYVFK